MRNTLGAATSNDQILIPALGPNVPYAAAERRFGRCLKTIAVRAAALLIFLLVSAGAARAQSLYGSIRGTVTDTSGGVIPDVTVTATNIATGVIQEVKTHADGTYAFLQLPIGDYSVKAAKDGFQSFNANKIHIDLNTVFTQDIHLMVGTMTEQVEVEASALQVETANTQLGVVIDSNQMVTMPLLARNFVNLQQMQPGVVGGADRFGTGSQTNFSTNGGESQFNVFLIDGVDTNDIVLNDGTFTPSLDALTEFRMVSGTMNAEYARSSGAIVSAVVKSGTNSFHGDAFEFYRDTFLNAREYFPPPRAPALPSKRFWRHDRGAHL